MKTDSLIRALALDAGRPGMPVGRLVATALIAGGASSLLVFVLAMQPRPDIDVAFTSPGFCLKVVVTLGLALSSTTLLGEIARPVPRRRSLAVLAWAPVLLAVGVAVELAVLPGDAWPARLIGRNAPHCLLLIPTLAAAPAIFLMLALRRTAPHRPGLAGAVVGLTAGGIGAVLYAFTCPDDSPLFVAAWYTLAIGFITAACALAGRRWLSW